MSKGCKIYCVSQIKCELILRCCRKFCAISTVSSSAYRAVNMSENKIWFLRICWLPPFCSRVTYNFTRALGIVAFESCVSPGRSPPGTSRRSSAPGHDRLGRWTILEDSDRLYGALRQPDSLILSDGRCGRCWSPGDPSRDVTLSRLCSRVRHYRGAQHR